MSSYEIIKHIVEVNLATDKNRIVYEISKVVDQKIDILASKVAELQSENKNLVADH